MITLGTMLPNMLEVVIIDHHPIWEFHGIPIGQALWSEGFGCLELHSPS